MKINKSNIIKGILIEKKDAYVEEKIIYYKLIENTIDIITK